MNESKYTLTAKALHWLIAGMIVAQYVLANLAGLAAEDQATLRQLALLANHKSLGISILGLALIRLIWRATHRPPPLPATMPAWQVVASRLSHGLLYVLLFALPLSGWLMSSASAYSVSWFNLFQLPDFVAPDPGLKETLTSIHEALAMLLAAVASLHLLAALKHGLIDKDGVLGRMSLAPGLIVLATAAGLAVIVLGRDQEAGETMDLSLAEPPEAIRLAEGAIEMTDLPRPPESGMKPPPTWQVDYETSHIAFVGDQAGAEFRGLWPSWRADIRFAEGNLASSAARVAIDTGAADTEDSERDKTIVDADWFDAQRFPQAYFDAASFVRNEDGSFTAEAELTIKGRTTPVAFNFSVDATEDRRTLVGTANLDRLRLGVGVGEWLDTTWVGQYVQVEVRVEATLPSP